MYEKVLIVSIIYRGNENGIIKQDWSVNSNFSVKNKSFNKMIAITVLDTSNIFCI